MEFMSAIEMEAKAIGDARSMKSNELDDRRGTWPVHMLGTHAKGEEERHRGQE